MAIAVVSVVVCLVAIATELSDSALGVALISGTLSLAGAWLGIIGAEWLAFKRREAESTEDQHRRQEQHLRELEDETVKMFEIFIAMTRAARYRDFDKYKLLLEEEINQSFKVEVAMNRLGLPLKNSLRLALEKVNTNLESEHVEFLDVLQKRIANQTSLARDELRELGAQIRLTNNSPTH